MYTPKKFESVHLACARRNRTSEYTYWLGAFITVSPRKGMYILGGSIPPVTCKMHAFKFVSAYTYYHLNISHFIYFMAYINKNIHSLTSSGDAKRN